MRNLAQARAQAQLAAADDLQRRDRAVLLIVGTRDIIIRLSIVQ
jgi:hypothetical protein